MRFYIYAKVLGMGSATITTLWKTVETVLSTNMRNKKKRCQVPISIFRQVALIPYTIVLQNTV